VSVEALSRCLRVQGLSSTDKLVLLGIANHDGDGGAWPTVATLAVYAGVHPRNVKRSLRRLERYGVLLTSVNGGGSGNLKPDERPNLYAIVWQRVRQVSAHRGGLGEWVLPDPADLADPDPDRGDASATPNPDRGDARATPRGDATATGGVTHAPPKPSYNRPVPTSENGLESADDPLADRRIGCQGDGCVRCDGTGWEIAHGHEGEARPPMVPCKGPTRREVAS
jgi:hypothetical protein